MSDEKRRQLLMTLTGLCFTASFLSAGFLAASDTFLTVKGTPYLQAGLVIFCDGVSGMEPGAERLAGHRNEILMCLCHHSTAKTITVISYL